MTRQRYGRTGRATSRSNHAKYRIVAGLTVAADAIEVKRVVLDREVE